MDSVPKNASFRTAGGISGEALKSSSDVAGRLDAVREAIERTQAYYLQHQHSSGYWWYELESNVTITAEYLLLLHFLGKNDGNRDSKIARHLLKNQNADGTWSIHRGGRGDLSATVEAYFALKLAGFSPDDKPLLRARRFILQKGGAEASRVFTKIFLALFGQYDWKEVPSIPVEFNLLPRWFPINIYEFSSWARSTIVPLSMILDIKPVRQLPDRAGIRELFCNPPAANHTARRKHPLFSWQRFFIVLDRIIKLLETLPVRPLREKAMMKTEKWIFQHQGPAGDWGGIQPAMVNSILALTAKGYSVTSEPVSRGLEALERFSIERDDEIVLQSCISPVWDTALTSLALIHSGLSREHHCFSRACRWLSARQIFTRGDWSVKRPGLKPGGWAFEFENSWYPDIDDTAVVLQLLYRFADRNFINAYRLERGTRWVLGMQGEDGGWGAFDADNNMTILNKLPFGDLEAMIDPSTPDITGRVLELLGLLGYRLSEPSVQNAINFLKRSQEHEGCWWGRWGVNFIYGTSSVLVGLGAMGEDPSRPYVRKAVEWLKSAQNLDGGWGECCESYEDPSMKCCGPSTPSQTAWALMGLIAAGESVSDEVSRGIDHLIDRQKPDGTWEEELFTGTGFPKYFMLRYHNYRNCFPLMALGKYLSGNSGKGK